MMNYIVESDIVIRAVDRPFNKRQIIGTFSSSDSAYGFIEKYIEDTKFLHTYFSRNYLCSKDEYEERIQHNRLIAINIVLGQFEDMLYVRRLD